VYVCIYIYTCRRIHGYRYMYVRVFFIGLSDSEGERRHAERDREMWLTQETQRERREQTHEQTHTHTHTHTYTHIYSHTQTCTHTYKHTRTHTYTHTHIGENILENTPIHASVHTRQRHVQIQLIPSSRCRDAAYLYIAIYTCPKYLVCTRSRMVFYAWVESLKIKQKMCDIVD